MKSKHVVLFLLSCVLLYISDIYGSSLIALALFFQVNLLLLKIPFTKKTQIIALQLFVCSIPLFLFLGGIHSFLFLYYNEGQWLFFLFACIISFSLCLVAHFLSLFVFNNVKIETNHLAQVYQNSFNEIKNHKKEILLQTVCIFILTFIPVINSDWKIIFGLTATQLYLRRKHLTQVFLS